MRITKPMICIPRFFFICIYFPRAPPSAAVQRLMINRVNLRFILKGAQAVEPFSANDEQPPVETTTYACPLEQY
jgi:hypothetical protein